MKDIVHPEMMHCCHLSIEFSVVGMQLLPRLSIIYDTVTVQADSMLNSKLGKGHNVPRSLLQKKGYLHF